MVARPGQLEALVTDLRFTLIAHKPESSDYCRGCLMDRWWGDNQIHSAVNEADVIELGIGYLTRETEDREAGYTLTVIGVTDGQLVTCSDLIDYGDNDDPAMTRIRSAIISGVDRATKTRQEMADLAKAAKLQRETEAKVKQELAELDRLRAKYHGA